MSKEEPNPGDQLWGAIATTQVRNEGGLYECNVVHVVKSGKFGTSFEGRADRIC